MTSEKITFHCAQCGKRLSMLKSKMGTKFSCPYCGSFCDISPNTLAPESTTQSPDQEEIGTKEYPKKSTRKPEEKKPVPQKENKKESALITYALLGIALLLCSVSILLFNKTLAFRTASKSPIKAEDLLIDKEAEHSIYKPVDIEGEALGLDEGLDSDISEKIKKEALVSNTPEESDIQEIYNLFSQFAKEKDLSKKLPLVFAADAMKPLMERWHASNETKVLPSPDIILRASHNPPFMLVRFSLGSSKYQDAIFIKENKSAKWKIDWPSLVGYSDYTGKELQQARPEKPISIRAILSMADKYEPPFMDRPNSSNYEGKSYLSVNVTLPDGQEFLGFVDRHTDTAMEISESLIIGPVPMIVSLRFPSSPDIKNKNLIIIDRLVRDNWLSDQANELLKKSHPPDTQP